MGLMMCNVTIALCDEREDMCIQYIQEEWDLCSCVSRDGLTFGFSRATRKSGVGVGWCMLTLENSYFANSESNLLPARAIKYRVGNRRSATDDEE